MTSLRWFGFTTLSTCLLLATFGACSSEDTPADDDDSSVGSSSGGKSSSSGKPASSSSSSGGRSSSSSGGASSSSGGVSSSSSSSGDAATPLTCADAGAPNLDGGSFCGSTPFRRPPAQFAPADPSIGPYTGGIPAAGTYDAVQVGTTLTPGGTWQETLVLDGLAREATANTPAVVGHFTRTRQVRTSAAGQLGPLAQRSGTYTIEGVNISFVDECATLDEEPADAGTLGTPFTVYTDECGLPALRYGGNVVIIMRQ